MPKIATPPAAVAPAAPVEAAAPAAATPASPPPITRPPLPVPGQRPSAVGLAPIKDAGAEVKAKLDALPADAPHEQVMAAMGLDATGAPLGQAPAAAADGEVVPPSAPAAVADPARPEWLPAKFKDPAEMAKAYNELEKKLGQKPAGEPLTLKKPVVNGPDGKLLPDAEQAFALDEAGMAAMTREWIEQGGKLTDGTYEKLAKVGITREFADRYGKLEQASLDAHRDALLTEQGLTGQGFDELAAWARTGLKADEIEAVEAMFASQNPAQHRMGLTYLKQAHAKANPAPAKPRISGSPAGSQAGQPITSSAEFHTAISDPRYRQEGATGDTYRKEVFARIRAGGYSAG